MTLWQAGIVGFALGMTVASWAWLGGLFYADWRTRRRLKAVFDVVARHQLEVERAMSEVAVSLEAAARKMQAASLTPFARKLHVVSRGTGEPPEAA